MEITVGHFFKVPARPHTDAAILPVRLVRMDMYGTSART